MRASAVMRWALIGHLCLFEHVWAGGLALCLHVQRTKPVVGEEGARIGGETSLVVTPGP